MAKHKHSHDCICKPRGFLAGLISGRSSFGVGELRFPDTVAAKAAEAYLGALSSSVMVDHCKRSFLFGRALADKARARPDLEALYVGCLFYDLGLEPIFDGPDDFEKIGAREASRFLNAKGYPALAEKVSAAIAIHTSVETAGDPRPEVAYLNMGATVDVLGMRIDQIDAKLIQKIVENYPRNGTKAMLVGLLGHEIRTKPQSNFAKLEAGFDVLARINDAPFDS